jgi:hypothetical protein
MCSPAKQAEFPSLIAPDSTKHEGIDIVVANMICEGGQGCLSNEDLKNKCDEVVDCTTTADIVSACILASAQRFEYPRSLDLVNPVPAAMSSIYDPARPVLCIAPPKRFFRTFWISVARRLLQKDTMDDA